MRRRDSQVDSESLIIQEGKREKEGAREGEGERKHGERGDEISNGCPAFDATLEADLLSLSRRAFR